MTRALLAACLSLFSMIACAQETAADYEPTEQEILWFALEQMSIAMTAFEDGARECVKVRRVLDPALFKSISLSNNEWQLALDTLGLRAMKKCVEGGSVRGRALITLMQFKAAEKYYKGKNPTRTYEPEFLCCVIWEREITQELKYQKLDPQARKVLESIPELNEPFDIYAAGDALGVMKE